MALFDKIKNELSFIILKMSSLVLLCLLFAFFIMLFHTMWQYYYKIDFKVPLQNFNFIQIFNFTNKYLIEQTL